MRPKRVEFVGLILFGDVVDGVFCMGVSAVGSAAIKS